MISQVYCWKLMCERTSVDFAFGSFASPSTETLAQRTLGSHRKRTSNLRISAVQ